MNKLFALEEEKEDNVLDDKEMLVDKVLRLSKKEKTPIHITTDIIKERTELRDEIEDKFNKESEESDDSEEDSEGDSEDDSSGDSDTDSSDDESDSSSDSDDDESDEEDIETAPKDDSKDDSEKDKGDEEEEKDDDKEDSSKGDDDEEDDKTATEALRYRLTPGTIFTPLRRAHATYLTALESYSLADNIPRVAMEEQPVVYVKDSVLESINNLIKIAEVYIANNDKLINNIAPSIKSINEELALYKTYTSNDKVTFNFKLVSDEDIMSNLAIPGKSDLRETVKILNNYLENSASLILMLLGNSFDDIKSSFVTSGFSEAEGFLEYKKTLPGFNVINVSLINYVSYVKTNLDEYSYYKLKKLKAEDLFNLPSIEITKDNELEYIIEQLDKALISTALIIDNLITVNTNLQKFIDEIKVMLYDVKKDNVKKLTNIGIDDKIKDFVKFKLTIEISYINVNIVIDYITSTLSVFKKTIELRE